MAKPNLTGGIVEYASPGYHLTLAAGGAISGGQLVKVTDDVTVEVAVANDLAVGIALYSAEEDDAVTIATKGVWGATASGAISAGDFVGCAAAGKVKTAAKGHYIVGQALEDIGNGEVGPVLLLTGGRGGEVAKTVPGAPTIGTATPGSTQATVPFTAPADDGGSAITGYTATSTPGSHTGTGASSPITVTGLTNGTPYTFKVKATNAIGTGAESAASNSVTPS